MLLEKKLVILLIGGSSWIASYLKKKYSNSHVIYTAGRSSNDDYYVDLEKCLFKIPQSLVVDVAVYCAGIGSLDLCKQKPKLAFQVNSYGCKQLAQLLDKRATRSIFLSTSQVFGSTQLGRSEYNITRPDCIYGTSKKDAEMHFLSNPGATIIRLSKVIGKDHGFLAEMIKSLNSGMVFYALSDMKISPIHISTATDAIHEAILRKPQEKIVHISGKKDISYYELCSNVSNLYGFNSSCIKSILCSEKSINYRPMRSGLDCTLERSKSFDIQKEIEKLIKEE